MSISNYIKYPFAEETIKYLKDLEIDIFSLSERYPDVMDAAVKNIETILENGEYLLENQEYGKDKLYPNDEILLYPTTKMLIEIINNDFLRNKFADVISKRTSKFLSKENTPFIKNIVENTFNWNLSFDGLELNKQYDYKMKFYDYLSVAPNLRDSTWKLINRKVEAGWVFLKKQEIIRLISEKVKQNIVKRPISKKELPKIPEIIKDKVDNLQEIIQKHKSNVESKFQEKLIINKDTYPPCITNILTKLKNGENLDHMSRLVFLFFFLNIGKSIEEIVDLFRVQPDFNEKKTTYYIEHAAGKRGSGTRYSSFACAKINTYGLCRKEEDFWCQTKNIKHPMQYLAKKNWKIQNVIIPKILVFPLLIVSNKKNERNLY